MLPTREVTLEFWVKPGVDSSFYADPDFERWSKTGLFGCATTGLSRYDFSKEEHLRSKGVLLGFEHFGVSTRDMDFALGMKNVSSFPVRLIRPNRWYHVAGTWDGKYQRVYLDGKLRDSVEREGEEGRDILYTDCNLVIGPFNLNNNSQLSTTYPVEMAEVRLWNISRTPREILEAHNRRIEPTTPGLIGLWRYLALGDNGSYVLQDLSGHQPTVNAQNSMRTLAGALDFPISQTESVQGDGLFDDFCMNPSSNFCGAYMTGPVAKPHYYLDGPTKYFKLLNDNINVVAKLLHPIAPTRCSSIGVSSCTGRAGTFRSRTGAGDMEWTRAISLPCSCGHGQASPLAYRPARPHRPHAERDWRSGY